MVMGVNYLLWWLFYNVSKYQIIMWLYTWNNILYVNYTSIKKKELFKPNSKA